MTTGAGGRRAVLGVGFFVFVFCLVVEAEVACLTDLAAAGTEAMDCDGDGVALRRLAGGKYWPVMSRSAASSTTYPD